MMTIKIAHDIYIIIIIKIYLSGKDELFTYSTGLG